MLPWFVVLLPLAFTALWAAKPLLIPRVRTYKRAAQIRTLLNPPHLSLGSLLLARAAPNERLVHAFELTSTFVSSDTKVHKTFTTKAKALIAGAGEKDGRWREVALIAEATVHQFMPIHQSVDFATLVQCITFSVVLSTLFDADLDALRCDDVVYVTNIINQRWKDSKIKDAAAMRQDDSLRRIFAHIDRWIVDHDQYPNPLNFILPAYETLWRVVAVTVAYVYRCHDNTLHDVAIAFGRDPTEERFQTFGENGQPSMQAIILEVLRLHPPTRHIARAPTESRSWWRALVTPAVELADVEAVHLSDDYGKNTSEFDPMRFHPSRTNGQPELYSFGYGKLKCIAASWAPVAAAVIAAKVVAQIEEARCAVTVGPKIGGRSGWDGWAVGKETK
ncbi:hypothetical protein HD554DRAFT_2023729 [Boletus coccyginus]|nr:hypothetical protein HD554DRAFT_2023729 [Boletus coccyginus]